jgi:hypothetical protein
MKTDNSNIVVSERLNIEAIAETFRINEGFTEDANISYVSGFDTGRNWQKEEYKGLLESHAELLAALKTIVFIGDMSERFESSKRIVEKANSIILLTINKQ